MLLLSIVSDRSQADHTGVVLLTFSSHTRQFAASSRPELRADAYGRHRLASCLNISLKVCGSRLLMVLRFVSMRPCSAVHSHLCLSFAGINSFPTH